jgi:hypothetical protein
MPPSTRIPRRRLVPPLTAIGAAILAFSCGGGSTDDDGCATTTAPYTPEPLTVLSPRYVLESVDGQPLPATLRQEGTRTVAVLADTLTFPALARSATDGEFGEVAVTSSQEGGAPAVVTRAVAAPGTRSFSRGSGGTGLTLTAFVAGANVSADAFPGSGSQPATLQVRDFQTRPGQPLVWQYVAR